MVAIAPSPAQASVKIRVEDVSFFYGNSQALFNVNMAIEPSRVTALIGPSGCGKSSFLRALNRMNDTLDHTRLTGRVLVDGKDIYASGTDVSALRRKIGMVFQKSNPFPKSVFENVAYGPRISGLHDRRRLSEIVERSLRRAALWEEVQDRLDHSAIDLLSDDEVDSLRDDIFAMVMEEMRRDAERLEQWVQLLAATRDLERIADLATNISQDVIYLVEGDVVRHQHVESPKRD